MCIYGRGTSWNLLTRLKKRELLDNLKYASVLKEACQLVRMESSTEGDKDNGAKSCFLRTKLSILFQTLG
jgi:hypothetical protein